MSLTDIIQTEEGMEDALFERIVEYILIIPEHYQEDLLAGKTPVMESKKVRMHMGLNLRKRSSVSMWILFIYIRISLTV